MAEMKARHAFGKSSSIEAAKQTGKINEFDILFLDGDTDPKIGWLDAQGNTVIVPNKTDLSGVEAELATKATTEEVDEKLTAKADVESVTALETQIATKADATEVDEKINTAVTDSIASAKAYTDGKVEAAISEHMVKKFEITSIPEGTLVDYRDKEIRVMCPVGTKWVKQSVGATGNANMYYMGFKAYAPEGAVGFKEGDRGVIVDEYFDFNGDFAGTDEYGRNYSICWLALASYNETSGEWTYFGKNSSEERFIGWDYIVEWYNSDGVVIASDCVRINLSNEGCHSSTKPYYVGGMMKEIDAMVDKKVAEATVVEVVEF